MAVPLNPLLWTGIALVAAPFAFYTVFLGLLVTPFFQRHALYAHKINTLLWSDVNRPESWGFAINQVTPFTLDTPDGESVYAWHILPLPLYLKNEGSLASHQPGLSPNIAETESFRLLKEDPEARLNAGHIAQAVRPDTYHALTDTSSYHVVAIDYRGFGHSTGVPSENGLIVDASTLVEWAVNVAGIPPSRIVLLGHSLGTAVVSGVAERYALKGVEFAGIVLVAGFGDLASMLSGYRIGGFIPLLGPFAAWPSFVRLLDRFIVDKWHSASRLTNVVRHTKTRLRLSMVHAKNDRDIPWTEDNKLFRAAANETAGGLDDDEFEAWKEQRTVHKGRDAFVTTWKSSPDIIIRQELFPYGSHDPIMGYAPVALAIMRSFDFHGTVYT
ncbi:Abhydrolase domain-containing protein 12B [Tolypocladium paradoxum]|uniref:Abhydrolase domain-containing protein 12B n=1 Tax=Tolypocladium paradoxum TaxID=94208 RepID=A0A2S4KQE1_9HYPO|nr:Abhydrolase domain-containing protein 12B [Tolypocladium paradoxum]